MRRRRQTRALAGLLATAALISAACSGNRHPVSPATASGPIARGTASWYGPKFDGRRTASGERYDMRALTAAHPSLPFGTLVQVTNLDNGRQVVVRINDRGPFGRHRVIDLSYAAARELEMVGPGTAEVELAVIGPTDQEFSPTSVPVLLAAAGAAAPSAAASARFAPTARSSPTSPTAPAAPAGSASADEPASLASTDEPASPAVSASPAGPTSPAPADLAASDGAPADGSALEDRAGLPGPGGGPPDRAAGGTARVAEPASLNHAAGTGGIRTPLTAPAGLHYTVQVGAFGEPERAEALRHNLSRLHPEAAVHSDGIWNRVQIGSFGDREQAETLRRELEALGVQAIVVTAR